MLYALGYLFWVAVAVLVLIGLEVQAMHYRYKHPVDTSTQIPDMTPEQEEAWEDMILQQMIDENSA